MSDRIAIMAFGKIRCLGNSLHLKNKYGSGYRIALATDKDASNSVIKRLQKSWEKIEVISNDAGSVFLTIPKDVCSCFHPTLFTYVVIVIHFKCSCLMFYVSVHKAIIFNSLLTFAFICSI